MIICNIIRVIKMKKIFNMTAISSVISKLGCEGLYITTLTDLMLLYSSDSGNYYEVYR